MKVYFGWSVYYNCRRHQIAIWLRNATMLDVIDTKYENISYCWPYFISCDHWCYHGKSQHWLGASTGWCEDELDLNSQATRRKRVFDNCMSMIRNCDIFYAWIDSKECYWTINEIGIAYALWKKVKIAIKEWFDYDDMRFCTTWWDVVFAKDAVEWFEKSIVSESLKCMEYQSYLKTDHWMKLSKEVKERDWNKCVLCASTKFLNAHHRSYVNRWDYKKEILDVHTVCNKCHKKYHDK